MYQRETGRRRWDEAEVYHLAQRPGEEPRASRWLKQCVGAGCSCAGECVARDWKHAPDAAPLLDAGGSGRGNVQLGPYHSGRDGGHAKSGQSDIWGRGSNQSTQAGKAGQDRTLRRGKEPPRLQSLGCFHSAADRLRLGRAQGRSRAYLTRAIGSNDGGEPLKWSDNLPTLVRFKVLDLNQLQELTAAAPSALRKAAPFARQLG